VLGELARSNMFLVALDARAQWYRYHHLFGELLRLELGREPAREVRVRWLPPELLIEHPLLPAAGAAAAGLVARPEMEVQRLLAVAERARRQRPQAWSPYIEATVELTRAEVIERGDVGAAVQHARRAVAAARAGAEVLSVGALATLS
jgi:hypothetical protein